MRSVGVLVKFIVLGIVVTAAGWLIWRSAPPFSPGFHTSAVAAFGSADGLPRIGKCSVFPADNVWNSPVDTLPKDPSSDVYIGNIGPAARLHPDFGSSALSGLPFTEVPPNTRPTPVTFDYVTESDAGKYPIPTRAPIEGGVEGTGDRHIILIDQGSCTLYELFDTHPQSDGTWTAGAGVKFDMNSDQLRPEGMTSADAAGLPIFPGLVRYEEVAAGEINHALRFTIPHTRDAFIWPARHKASRIKDPGLAPMGQRFRLRADYDISGFSKSNQVILTALKRYGMFLADNGGAIFISGAPDKRWDDGDLHNLSKVTAEDFEAVDESRWATTPNSARVVVPSSPAR